MTDTPHIPVLLKETLDLLDIQEDDHVLDGTIGFCGHSTEMLSKLSPQKGLLIGLDQDQKAIDFATEKFGDKPNALICHTNFYDFEQALKDLPIDINLSKVLIDIGMSSYHLDSSERGFSYLRSEALDMRMDTRQITTAASILNSYNKKQLSDMFYLYGELFHNKILSENIVAYRKKEKFKTTDDLIQVIKKSYFFNNSRSKFLKTCAQIFQALRIEVNEELENLTIFLKRMSDYLQKDSRIAIITFHSLEDRIVKHHFRKLKDDWLPLTKKPLQASQEEIGLNSRSKPAKLRVYVRK